MTDRQEPAAGTGPSQVDSGGTEVLGPTDRLGRVLRDLRISVTDRCNFRCVYCMPREIFGPDFEFLGRDQVLTFEEIERLARVFVGLGVRKLRITGGEPLLRKDLEDLVAMLASTEGVEDLALTTNASLLARKAEALARAGLHRVTVSLDALDPERFQAMADTRVPVGTVLQGIDAALTAGLIPVRVNAVVKRGTNEDQIVPLARRFRGTGVTVRFIEYMDVGTSNGWRLDEVVPAREILDRLQAEWDLEALDPRVPGEVATRYGYSDGAGEIGVIASVTRPFCQGCTRARITARGEFFTCLFGSRGHDFRAQLRGGASDGELTQTVREIWAGRRDRYSELRTKANRGRQGEEDPTATPPRVEMFQIGG
jgi:GTP 3',8-cyclase